MGSEKNEINDLWMPLFRSADSITQKIQSTKGIEDSSPRAIERLFPRLYSIGKTLHILCHGAEHDFSLDAAILLRAAYDTTMQILYILQDPEQIQARSDLYEDFYWVEKKRYVERIDKNPGDGPKIIGRKSPMRMKHEPEMIQEFNRVKETYTGKKEGMRDTWYPGSLRDLAKKVGWGEEYDLFQYQFSGVTHSSAFALEFAGAFSVEYTFFAFWRLFFRVLGRIVQIHNIQLSDEEREVVALGEMSIWDIDRKLGKEGLICRTEENKLV
jgi:hypothetical protein